MPKNRAQRRHQTERRKARTRRILKRYGDAEWLNERRVGRFTESRWGCQCHICVNPRRLNKGKNSNSLTLKELHAHEVSEGQGDLQVQHEAE
jgi:hypothetical protein